MCSSDLHRRYLRTACFSRDGARVLTVGDGGPSPKLWDASSGRLLAELEGHRQGVRFATFSPNGLLISSADVDNVAMLWDGHSGRLLWELPGSTHQLSASAFSPDGAVLVTGLATAMTLAGFDPENPRSSLRHAADLGLPRVGTDVIPIVPVPFSSIGQKRRRPSRAYTSTSNAPK